MLRFNADAAKAGLCEGRRGVGPAVRRGDAAARRSSTAVEALFGQLKVPRRLRDVGVPREALPEIAGNAMGDWFLRGNPRPVRDAAELLQILEQAW